MKFISATVLASAVLALAVTAQGTTECTTCLQDSLIKIPACDGLNITLGADNPGTEPKYAVCLCASLDGNWVDACIMACGPDVVALKTTYGPSLEEGGLDCKSEIPTFNPDLADTVDPSSGLPTGTSPPGSAPSNPTGEESAGVAGSLPWTTGVIGALTVVAAVGASFL